MYPLFREYAGKVTHNITAQEVLVNFSTDEIGININILGHTTGAMSSLAWTKDFINIKYMSTESKLEQTFEKERLKDLVDLVDGVCLVAKTDGMYNPNIINYKRHSRIPLKVTQTLPLFMDRFLEAISNRTPKGEIKSRKLFVTHAGIILQYTPEFISLNVVLHTRDIQTGQVSIIEHMLQIQEDNLMLPSGKVHPIAEGCSEYERIVLNQERS